jgi:sugar O-acyltransferase (sialic acid O-acetyltransferase NeuD family)
MRLAILGLSHILSDLVDCALERGDEVVRVLVDQPISEGDRDLPWAQRLAQWEAVGVKPRVQALADWQPADDERVILGPTTPLRQRLVRRVEAAHGTLRWAQLVHPSASVSRLAGLNDGCFVGAGAVIAAGVRLGRHVFVNRCASIGHDCQVGDYARLQPRATLGGLIDVGAGATIGIGATVIERLRIGAESMVAAGALVRSDVAQRTLVAGAPARLMKQLPGPFVG